MGYAIRQRLLAIVEKLINRRVVSLLYPVSPRRSANTFCVLTNEQGKIDLRIYRLERHCLSQYLPRQDQAAWLVFYRYKQADGQDFITLYDTTASVTPVDSINGDLMLVKQSFLAKKSQLTLSKLVQQSPGQLPLPFPVTDTQRSELRWLIDKIESLIGCDYRYRLEYIQELLMQLIHFLLKQSGSFESQKPTQHPFI